MKRHKSFAVLLCAAALSSCDYEKNAVQDIVGDLPASQIKFFNFGIGAPAVNFYANDTKVTAVFSSTGTEAVTGVGYGGEAAGGLYAGIEPGQYTLTGRIAAATDKDLPISSVAATIEDGKSYSYYQSGVYNTTTKTVDAFVVEDAFPAEIEWSGAQVRFVNAIFNSNPMTLYATHSDTGQEQAVGGDVAYKTGGAFTLLPTGSYSLSTRSAGSATNILRRTGVSFVAGRVYTITARGDITVASTSTTTCASTNRTCLDNAINR